MVKEASGLVILNQSPVDVRLVKPLKVVVKGSLAAESSDYATLARAAQLVAGTSIRKDLPYTHVAEGHGYPLEELDPREAPFVKNNMPVEGVSISEDAVVTYSIEKDEKDPSHILSGGQAMAVAISSEGLVESPKTEPEVVNLNMAFRDKDPLLETVGLNESHEQAGEIDPETRQAQSAWASSLLNSVKK